MENSKFKQKRIKASKLGNIARWGNMSQEQRFWSHVNRTQTNACWEWIASRNPKGYGRLKFASKSTLAHRVSWEIAFGLIPDGKNVCHHCDNPPCCNPKHLFVGTNADNMKDCVSKNRQAHLNGERCGRSKLSEQSVRYLIEILKTRKDFSKIAEEFGISNSCVHHIRHGRTWKHIQGV